MTHTAANAFFYEDFHRADADIPYVDTKMTDISCWAHFHEEIELVLVREGQVEITVEGQSCVASEGDVAVILPFHIHSLSTPCHSRLYILKLLSPQLDFSRLQLQQFVRHDPQALRQSIEHLVQEYESKDHAPLRRLALKSATGTLLVKIARFPDFSFLSSDALVAHDRDIQILKLVDIYLQEHWREDIRLEAVAAHCHMSLYYFVHTFKKITGSTFGHYLTAYRLALAKSRMQERKETMAEIAMHCGFSSIRTFNRCFQAHYKMTPTEARRRWLGTPSVQKLPSRALSAKEAGGAESREPGNLFSGQDAPREYSGHL